MSIPNTPHPSIIITGAGGQVGAEATSYFIDKGWQVKSFTRSELDITDSLAVDTIIAQYTPTFLFNAAAYTNVDGAQSHKETCFLINTHGVKNLVRSCNTYRVKLIHISTDYIFDGKKGTPYTEDDHPNPCNIYGESKLAAEQIITSTSNNWLILRTSWVYSHCGKNFLTTMITLSEQRDSLSIVNDQWGVPTSALQIVESTYKLLQKQLQGVFNVVAQGETTWYSFAQEIFRLLNCSITLHPCTSLEYPQNAQRPHYSVLSTSKLISKSINNSPWQEALAVEIAQLKDIQ